MAVVNALAGYPLPAFLEFIDHGDGTGLLRAAPGVGDRGDYTLTIVAADDGDGGGDDAVRQDRASFVLTVESPNEPPRLAHVGDRIAVFDQPGQILVRATDLDEDALTFQFEGLPSGASTRSSPTRFERRCHCPRGRES